ncbi:tRNA lysidine(34) synthetase TilS [Lacticaseibacillus songhuajiangensis]|uniref:tRNA lysidine(34) synthetase TilS n=1 Tax=Lacticaseibacillus songhuajiangensis TaxID=1296539 RepID=UPI000F7A745F|nr:tRNA lysidine(34) synthetase TilS [Lacticaseibacillus songhuajiangensis]
MLSSKQLAEQLQTLQVQPGSALLVAVSGGADSLALLDLLLPLRAQMQLQLAAVHINHELRPESQAEEKRVREYCHVHAVPLDVWHWQQAAHPASGTEAAARSFRYDQFERSAQARGSDYILTAHHRDDQAETVLFRMMRSGSVHGIGGIAARQTWRGKILLRPLLPYSREQLRTYAVQHELPFSDDPSNADTRYSRNFIRAEVLPLMRTREPRVDDHLNRLASETQGLLALANVTLRRFLTFLGPKTDEFDWTPVQDEERTVQKMVLQAALQRILPGVADAQVLQALAALEAADGRTRYVRLNRQRQLAIQGACVHVEPIDAGSTTAPRARVLNCDGPGVAYRQGSICLVTTVRPGDRLLAGMCTAAPLTLRVRQAGDRIVLNDGHHQKLRRTFINERVPADVRDCLLIAARGSDVVWIDDLRLNQLLKQPATDKIKANLVYRQ